MALLTACAALRGPLSLDLAAVTLDHGLRPEAATEAAMVARHCARLGVPHTTLHWRDWQGVGNLQAEARAARYRQIGAWAKAQSYDLVLLGHTQNDVAETFLMRLGRASGLEGLSQMRAQFTREGITWARPFLGLPRAALREYLIERSISWVEDPSNEDSDYTRVQMREALRALAPFGLSAQSIAQSAQALSQSREALEEILKDAWEARVEFAYADLRLDVTGLPKALARRLLIAALQRVGASVWPPRQSALEDLTGRLEQIGRHTLAGCIIRQMRDGQLHIGREPQAVAALRSPLGALWDGRWQIEGPSLAGAEIRPLGAGIAQLPDWRERGLPRSSLEASPAIWHGPELVAAPMAANAPNWTANLCTSYRSNPFAH